MSQPNEITLAVDEANNSTPVNHVFARIDEYNGRTIYGDADHSVASPNTLTFYRTFAKKSGNFYGTTKVAIKFSKEISVLGIDGNTIKAPVIIEMSCSLPVGITDAEALLARQKVVAIADRDDLMVPLCTQGQI